MGGTLYSDVDLIIKLANGLDLNWNFANLSADYLNFICIISNKSIFVSFFVILKANSTKQINKFINWCFLTKKCVITK